MQRWEKRPSLMGDPLELSRQLGIHPVTAQLLINRGYSRVDSAQAFLNTNIYLPFDPMEMQGMADVLSRIRQAADRGEKVTVYGDYDADGLCATAILHEALVDIGIDAGVYIPNRLDEGYGLSIDAIDRIALDGPSLIITVDCGITSVDEVKHAASRGMTVIVTDHHTKPAILPDCFSIIHALDAPYPSLTGAGIAYKLAVALTGHSKGNWLQWAALGTVGDIAPLDGENRWIVSQGIRSMEQEPALGIRALMQAAGYDKKTVNAMTLGYVLAPRINASGRMGDPMRALDLLLAKDASRAGELATLLNTENANRQRAEANIVTMAEEMLQSYDLIHNRAIVLYHPSWSHGIVGIAAARLAQRHHKPAIIMGCEEGICTGSGRSIPGVDLFHAMEFCRDLFRRFGGHAYAVGLTMAAEQVDAFRSRLNEVLSALDAAAFMPVSCYDMELTEADISLAKELELMEPFDNAQNPAPLFRLQGRLSGMRSIGSDGNTLKIEMYHISGVGFRMGSMAEGWHPDTQYDMLAQLSVNRYRGSENAQWIISELRCSRTAVAEDIKRNRLKFQRAIFRQIMYNTAILETQAQADWPDIIQSMKRMPQGVLLVASTQEDGQYAWSLLEENGLTEQIDVVWDMAPALPDYPNRLWLAPDPEQWPMAEGYAEVYFAGGLAPCEHAMRLPGKIPPIRLTRADVASVYRRLGSPASEAALIDDMEGKLSPAQVMLARQVLAELSLIAGDEEYSICPDAQRCNLMDSLTMQKVCLEGT